MICPSCAAYADSGRAAHNPAICRDFSIAGHGCACQHGVETTR